VPATSGTVTGVATAHFAAASKALAGAKRSGREVFFPLVERLERLRGEGRVAINYRHLLHSLVRKPGAFAHYRFQASLFPRLIFRVAYDELRQSQPGQAEREYLQLLQLAATESEEQVAAV